MLIIFFTLEFWVLGINGIFPIPDYEIWMLISAFLYHWRLIDLIKVNYKYNNNPIENAKKTLGHNRVAWLPPLTLTYFYLAELQRPHPQIQPVPRPLMPCPFQCADAPPPQLWQGMFPAQGWGSNPVEVSKTTKPLLRQCRQDLKFLQNTHLQD